MKKIFIILLIFSFNNLKSQINNNPNIDSLQISGLCKVWGLIKFYHSDVTKKKIDWDQILIKNYSQFTQKNDFELFNLKINNLIDTLGQKKNYKCSNDFLFNAIINNKLDKLDNFNFLSDSNTYKNRISFSWINDSIFSEKTKARLCEILINYKPYDSKQLKGRLVVRHKENKFKDLDSITEPYRILALFRYWNIINYFFPYKYLSDNDWDHVLLGAIPKFIEANSYEKYILELKQLSARINDSHGYYSHSTYQYYKPRNDLSKINDNKTGYCPYEFRLIDDIVVVSKMISDSTILNLGDTILSINNIDLVDYRNKLKKSKSQSTTQAEIDYYERGMSNFYGSKFVFKVVKNSDTISLTESIVLDLETKTNSRFKKPPYYYPLNDNSGYIDLTSIKLGAFKKAWSQFNKKRTIVFDLRGYPNSIVWLTIPHLLKSQSNHVASYYYPNKKYPGTYIDNQKGISYYLWLAKPFVMFRKKFKGKVIVLINSKAISQAETVCMMFKSYADDVTFIGTPTAGANGDISTVYLPGGISFNFSSLDWHYPDGKQLQRLGIIPDIYVKETIKGLKLGKDEILERAIQHIEKSCKKDLN